ncbi:MAG: rRNA maturation RNase YbeY [Candidatus Pacebacteria bacterium]|nr:rRNA maturation RNase YbeY [Candidatus Paceibacterota bacterium]
MVFKPEVLIYNLDRQNIPSKRFFCSIVEKSLIVLKERKRIVLSLIFVDSQNIRRLNNYWRGKNKETTILSFSLNETFPLELGKKEKILGDIFLCPEEIKRQVKRFDTSLDSFYQKLVVHGLLHLYGYTHGKKEDKLKMEYLENKILETINK